MRPTAASPPISSFACLLAAIGAAVSPAAAYVRPGAGLTFVGSLLGLLGTVALAVGGMLYVLFKRLFRRSGAAGAKHSEPPGSPGRGRD